MEPNAITFVEFVALADRATEARGLRRGDVGSYVVEWRLETRRYQLCEINTIDGNAEPLHSPYRPRDFGVFLTSFVASVEREMSRGGTNGEAITNES